MTLRDTLNWIGAALRCNRQRSVLTVTGIAIGILAVTLLTSIGEGLRVYLLDSFSKFGTRIIAVTPGRSTTQGTAGLLHSVRPLSLANSAALRQLPYVSHVVPLVTGTAAVESGRFSRHANVLGVGHEVPEAWKMSVRLGRFLPDDNVSNARAYAVLGARLRDELFAGRSPLGAWVRVGGTRFRVIGVMESKGQMLGYDMDDVIYIPVSRGLQLFNREGLMEVDVVFSEMTTSASMSARIRERLTDIHGTEDFTLFTQEDMLSSLDRILMMFTFAIGALGAISLFVGAVGILTIMTTSLQERQPEIGLLSAIGAERKQILVLFLGEAASLSLAGGLVGVLLGALLVIVSRWLLPTLPLAINPPYIVLALGLALLIGLLAGLGPAWRASRLNPVDALRGE